MKISPIFLLAFSWLIANSFAQNAPAAYQPELSSELIALRDEIRATDSTFNFSTGNIILEDGLATLNIPTGFIYLNRQESQLVLRKIGSLPLPDSLGKKFLGVLFEKREKALFTSPIFWIYYEKIGFVNDELAGEIDFQKLLKLQQKEYNDISNIRQVDGLSTVELVGWAIDPVYDKKSKTLYWGEEMQIGEYDWNNVNFHIYILGRKGMLTLHSYGRTENLPLIQSQLIDILGSIHFNEGYRYQDFDPDIDLVAIEKGVEELIVFLDEGDGENRANSLPFGVSVLLVVLIILGGMGWFFVRKNNSSS